MTSHPPPINFWLLHQLDTIKANNQECHFGLCSSGHLGHLTKVSWDGYKNVLQLLYIIAHEIIISNSVSEYTHGPWKVSDALIPTHETAPLFLYRPIKLATYSLIDGAKKLKKLEPLRK